MSVVEVSGLRKSYGHAEAVRGLDLQVDAGEIFCLLGPNGAGKTTTVEILEGFRARTGGDVRVLGMDPAGQPVALRERIGVVLQECELPGELRVIELLDAYRSYYSRPRPARELLDLVELADESGKLVRHLSGGQKRRLDLALALAGDPDLVFLDEPTTGFDPAARRRTWQAVLDLAALGKTVLLTTHYLDEAEALCEEIALIRHGRLIARDTAAGLRAHYGATSLEDVYVKAMEVGAGLSEPAGT
jgi:ABC-2 type transport system ATP-binding protein